MAGTCVKECNDCTVDELCCSNGCGHVCMVGVEITPICQGITARLTRYESGVYHPECTEDGNFKPIQCTHGYTSYCWCVRPETGVPLRSGVMRLEPPQYERPQCSKCVYDVLYLRIQYLKL